MMMTITTVSPPRSISSPHFMALISAVRLWMMALVA